ncbi:MAG: hypothetical protein KUG72_05965 [Pseudomonadales bacterium]|nr:hypothetical protein [Pseudomonadales bacterium]
MAMLHDVMDASSTCWVGAIFLYLAQPLEIRIVAGYGRGFIYPVFSIETGLF